MSAEGSSEGGGTKAQRRRVRGPWLIATAVLALALPGALIVFGVITGSEDDSGAGAGRAIAAAGSAPGGFL
jgi:uncharacterized membrane protein YdfJ with MMPL/SSD domain